MLFNIENCVYCYLYWFLLYRNCLLQISHLNKTDARKIGTYILCIFPQIHTHVFYTKNQCKLDKYIKKRDNTIPDYTFLICLMAIKLIKTLASQVVIITTLATDSFFFFVGTTGRVVVHNLRPH